MLQQQLDEVRLRRRGRSRGGRDLRLDASAGNALTAYGDACRGLLVEEVPADVVDPGSHRQAVQAAVRQVVDGDLAVVVCIQDGQRLACRLWAGLGGRPDEVAG